MNEMIIIYIPCESVEEAEKIGTLVMRARLAPCYNILTGMKSAAFWPPKTGEIEKVSGVVLLLKSVESKFTAIEKEIKSIHSDSNPCIFSIKIDKVSEEYYSWLISEMNII